MKIKKIYSAIEYDLNETYLEAGSGAHFNRNQH